MKALTIEDIKEMVAKDESRTLEVKQTTGELCKGMTSACAFLNTDGGWVIFGVTPKMKIVGQEVSDMTRQEIARELRKFSPAVDIEAQYIRISETDSKYVIAMYFERPDNVITPYTYDGRPYYKVENTTAPMPREMFDERIRLADPGKFCWEKMPNRLTDLSDLDDTRISMTISGGVNAGRIPPAALNLSDISERLDHFKLRDEDGNLTNAAIVLFGKDPSRFFSQCKVRLARFEGKVMDEFRDQTVCYGNLFEQYDAIINFCQKHMFLAGRMDEIERVDTLTVPFKAIREATLNLLVHRTWWSNGRTPSVAIFDDRIEFMNPGSFPIGTTAEDYFKRPHSTPVNPDISEVFYKSGLMEAWGRGIFNIVTECTDAGLPTPVFEKVTDFTCLTIRFKLPLTPRLSDEGVNEGVNEGVKKTLETIRNTPGITVPQIATKSGKSDATIERHIRILRQKGLIRHEGPAKTGGYYAIKK